jgi:hypothetical protein
LPVPVLLRVLSVLLCRLEHLSIPPPFLPSVAQLKLLHAAAINVVDLNAYPTKLAVLLLSALLPLFVFPTMFPVWSNALYLAILAIPPLALVITNAVVVLEPDFASARPNLITELVTLFAQT